MPPIIEELKDKRIAIMGFGREGKSVYSYIRKYLPNKQITIADEREIVDTTLTCVDFHCGVEYQELPNYDIIIKSPGIVLTTSCYMHVMDSMTNLFLKYYGQQTIGITGTKGKSTTSSLLYHILKKSEKNVVFLGNIGKPAFDVMDAIEEATIVVFELSCHQLEYVRYSPHIGVLLNIYEEHLDHYGTFEKYIHAKENIWRYQHKEDILLCEKNCQCANMQSEIIDVSMDSKDVAIYADVHSMSFANQVINISPMSNPLLGHHNMYDIAITMYIANQLFQISLDACKEALSTFTPLPHRLQYVGEYHGLHWYDDSISTICETTIQALKTLPQTSTLLVGGMDRGIDYTPLATYLNEHPIQNVIAMPDSGEVLSKLVKQKIHYVSDLETAVAFAKECTETKGIVLLSPAAASYGFFKDFEERGMYYQKYVKED